MKLELRNQSEAYVHEKMRIRIMEMQIKDKTQEKGAFMISLIVCKPRSSL